MAARRHYRRPVVGLVLGLALVLVLVGGGAVVVRKVWGPTCGAETVQTPRSPLQSTEIMAQRPDVDRDRTVAAVAAMGAPFGPVVAGVDYYYDQFLRLYGVSGGLLAWTKNNAPVTFLSDDGLDPRWSLRPTAQRTAWDVSAEKFLLLNLPDAEPMTISQFDLSSGEPGWCIELSARHQPGEPLATTFLDGGDVVAAVPNQGEIGLIRLSGKDGELRWSEVFATADRADYLGQLTEDLVLVGGSEESRLTDPAATSSGVSEVTAVDLSSGAEAWVWGDGPGTRLHVVGTTDGQSVLMVRKETTVDLVALSAGGSVLWRTRLPAGSREATLRGDVVVIRSDAGLSSFAASTGKPGWRRAIPTNKPVIPLGFSLGQMPSIDADHLLMPTVSSLELLDLDDGTSTSYPLPTDGLSSAYFPYQLLATAQHLGVVTNTGAVISARE